MAHFAQLDSNNVVTQVLVVANETITDENGIEQEALGVKFLQDRLGGRWVQTSYNAKFRKNYAGLGFTYDEQRNAFIPPKPFASWVLNEATCRWEAPVPVPNDGIEYRWDEATTSWKLMEAV